MRRTLARAVLSVGTVALVLTAAASAHAHGLAGKRFFPSTLTIDDPFVADELSLPTVLHIKEPGDGDTPARQNTTVSGEFSKRILPNLGLTFGGDWTLLDPAPNGKTESGFGDLPDALGWLKPLAVTGIVEGVLPSRSGNKTFMLNDDGDFEIDIEKNPNVFHWGFAVMYSLPY